MGNSQTLNPAVPPAAESVFHNFTAKHAEALHGTAFLLYGESSAGSAAAERVLSRCSAMADRIESVSDLDTYAMQLLVRTYTRERKNSVSAAADLPPAPAEYAAIWESLRVLSPVERAVLVLHLYREQTAAQVAGILQLSRTKVQRMMSAALARLSALLPIELSEVSA